LAWENYVGSPSGFHRVGANRLIAHAVQDDTLLRKYIPRVREFLRWAIETKQPVDNREQLDLLLADYLEEACYERKKGYDWGSNTFFGLMACFPELREKMPVSYRAYKAWQRLHVPGEGQGIPEEAVLAIADFFRQKGWHDFALITETAMDVYWRQGEWENLTHGDVVDDKETPQEERQNVLLLAASFLHCLGDSQGGLAPGPLGAAARLASLRRGPGHGARHPVFGANSKERTMARHGLSAAIHQNLLAGAPARAATKSSGEARARAS